MALNRYDYLLDEYRQRDGIENANATTYFTFDGETVFLYVNGVVRQTWTTAVVAPDLTGQPMGLLLSLTYAE
jgi:hypothetical protein